jgi:hypothetical protein
MVVTLKVQTSQQKAILMAASTATKKVSSPKRTREWTDEQKAAASTTRVRTIVARRYLGLLEAREASRRPGRRATPESVRARLETVNHALATEDLGKIERLELVQERIALEEKLADLEADDGFDEAEQAFIEHAYDWAVDKGFTYSALREVGVPAAVLRAAGIS